MSFQRKPQHLVIGWVPCLQINSDDPTFLFCLMFRKHDQLFKRRNFELTIKMLGRLTPSGWTARNFLISAGAKFDANQSSSGVFYAVDNPWSFGGS
jgi:hypothetical protein